jgi:hypothetical protein
LADTVRTEISADAQDNGIEDAFVHRNNEDIARPEPVEAHRPYLLVALDFLRDDILRRYLNAYFSVWHPLFPFLDGAYLIQCFDNAASIAQLSEMVASSLPGSSSASHPHMSSPAFEGLTSDQALVLSAIFKSIFSISSIDVSDDTPESEGSRRLPTFESSEQAMMYTHLIVSACQSSRLTEMFALQGLLAIQLYLYSRRKLRPAMHLSGISTSGL